MKRVLLMLAATAAFACTTAVAQTSAGTDTNAQTGTQATTTGHHHKKGGDMGDEANKGKSGKMSTLTGCLSASPNSDGMYTLSNGRYKSGVEVGPSDKVKDHAGHQVALKGHWGTAAQAGENTGSVASSTSEKGEKHFDVDNVKHIADTCKEAPGGGTMGHQSGKKHKGAKTDNGGAAGSANTPPPVI